MSSDLTSFETATGDWHRWLDSQPGHRAALRRAGSLAEVRGRSAGGPSSLPFVRLQSRLQKASADQVAIVAGLLAFLSPEQKPSDTPAEADEPASISTRACAQALGRFLANGGGKRGLTEIRFRRIHAVENGDREELFLRLGRVVRAYRGEIKPKHGIRPLDVASTAYWWGDTVREALALGYYTAVLSSLEEDPDTHSTTLA
ncbi:MAG: hypothetical protein AAGI52_04240 [Bacteroidota bacterium]